jgi:dolichyl-phosphate-mannose--protein O-mannosyl transferase
VDVYWGSPDSWNYHTNFSKNGVWQNWEDVHLGQETRYVRLVFKGRSGRIGEIALFSGGERLDVSGIVEEDDQGLGTALIDEQSLVIQPASHKSGTYFDEIYYVRAAEEHLKLEYPAGERTHPPMSKLLIAAGIKIFGHNPFAWRIVGVILATLMIPLIFSFAGRMFHSSRAGLIAAFLLTFDFMHFAEARIATPETYILFFVMFMFYFFYRYWQDPEHNGRFLFLSLVFFGLGFATKWVVMWGFIGLIILLLIRKWRKPILKNEVYWFVGGVGAAVSIYMLSWIPYFLAGYGLGDWWDYHWFMFEFHSGLEATHPFSSEWWTWPLMLRPLWLYVGYFSDTTSYIATLGNPALWWAGILAIIAVLPRLWWFFIPFPRLREMLMTLWWSVKYYSPTAAFILIPFLTQWLIFALIGRVLFIYHFYPNVLFIILACTLLMNWLWCRYRWGKWAVAGYLILNVVCFILFFPVISGLAMTEGYWDALRWMVSWVT